MHAMFKPNQRPWALGAFLVLVSIPIAVLALSSPGVAQETTSTKPASAKGSLPALATKLAMRFRNLEVLDSDWWPLIIPTTAATSCS